MVEINRENEKREITKILPSKNFIPSEKAWQIIHFAKSHKIILEGIMPEKGMFSKQMQNIKIAIDGTAASGKGTIASKLASFLSGAYLDTGKLYRTLAFMLQNILQNMLQKQPKQPSGSDYKLESLAKINDDVLGKFLADITEKEVIAIALDVAKHKLLETEEIGKIASKIASYQVVRDFLFNIQQEFIRNNNIAVLDGRDIGTVIMPKANFKFFITASLEERANRRYKQLQLRKTDVTYEEIFADLAERDKNDKMRKIAPLQFSQDYYLIDSSLFGADEIFLLTMGIIILNA